MALRTWQQLRFPTVALFSLLALSITPPHALAHEDDEPETEAEPTGASSEQGLQGNPTNRPSISLAPLGNGLNCGEISDSFLRLYRAYFDRQPTSRELDTAITDSRNGATLKALSTKLLESSEFAIDNGKLSDNEYTDFVFQQTLARQPTSTERTQWLSSLEGGHERAAMMLVFTESAEFVRVTQTATPLAGYARWYPEGTHWYCGKGSARVTIRPLTGARVSSDFMFVNTGLQPANTELWVLESNFNRNVQMTSGAIPPMFTDYNWDGLFSGDGDYGEHLDIEASDNVRWIVVFYPTSIGDKRPGWEIDPT